MVEPPDFDDPGPLPLNPPARLRRALSVAIVLLLVVSMVFLAWISGRGEVVVQPTPTPTAAPTDSIASRLVVVDPDGRLLTTDAAGGAVVTHGAAGVRYTFPAWSPDSSRIAAVGTATDGTAVHVFAVGAPSASGAGDGAGDPTVVYSAADRAPFYLYWAPDGRRLTFLTTEPEGLALRIAPADGGGAAILREGSPMYWAWTARDRLLVHSGGDAPNAFLGELGDDGSAVEAIDARPSGFRAPALSADGQYRAYVVPAEVGGFTPPEQRATERVVVEADDGTGRHQVDVFGEAVLGFGSRTNDLAFIAPAAAAPPVTLPVGPLRVVDAASRAVRTLVAGSVVAFFWSPDGRTITSLRIVAQGDDKIAKVAARGVIPAAPAPGLELRLAFVDVESGAIRSQTDVRLGDVFVSQVLPFFDQYALSHRVWAPDSAAIALPLIDDDGTTALVVLPADGSDARRVAEGVAGFWSP
jgi:TolB protein